MKRSFQKHFSTKKMNWGNALIGLITAANGFVGIVNLYQIYTSSFKGKVKHVVKELEHEKDYPLGVYPVELGLGGVEYIERNQKNIKRLLSQEDLHFSYFHGDSKVGKTTFIQRILEGHNRVVYLSFRGGDSAEVVLKNAIGLSDNNNNLYELFQILDESLMIIKKKNESESGDRVVYPLIIVEDLLTLYKEQETKIFITKKMLQFYEQKKASVVFVSNNRQAYNFFTNNELFRGMKEKLRVHQILPPAIEEIEKEIKESLHLNITDKEVKELFKYTGANFGDILSILDYYNIDLNLESAIKKHILSHEDNMKKLFEGQSEEEIYIKFNIFDSLINKELAIRSYALCWDDEDLFSTMETVIDELYEKNYIKRHFYDNKYIAWYRPFLHHVYLHLLEESLEIQERRKRYEKWKEGEGFI